MRKEERKKIWKKIKSVFILMNIPNVLCSFSQGYYFISAFSSQKAISVLIEEM
jgi:hypothetical protein